MDNQLARVDEESVAGEGRERLVGRVSIASRAQRQDLPQMLAARSQKINERARPVAKITDAETAGQRGWMKQDAARSMEMQQGQSSVLEAGYCPPMG